MRGVDPARALIPMLLVLFLYATVSAPQQKKPPARSGWIFHQARSEMTDSPVLTLELPASNVVQGRYRSYRPRLFIRCREGTLDTFVDVGMPADSTANSLGTLISPVRVRLDAGKAGSEWWAPGALATLFAAGVDDALSGEKYPGRLARAASFLFEFTPARGSPQVARFDLRGLGAVVGRVSRACGYDFAEDHGIWKFDEKVQEAALAAYKKPRPPQK